MKSKNKKITNKERDSQFDYLFHAIHELSKEIRMVRGLFENYIIWKKDVKKFTEYLQAEERGKSETRKAEPTEGSGTPKTDG